MRKILVGIPLLLSVAFVSCSVSDEGEVHSSGDVIVLKPDEFASLNYGTRSHEMEEDEAVSCLNEYFTDLSETRSLMSTESIVPYSVKKEYIVLDDDSESYCYVVRYIQDGDSCMAVVSGDNRFPELICNVKNPSSETIYVEEMKRRSIDVWKKAIARVDSYMDSLKTATLERINGSVNLDTKEVECRTDLLVLDEVEATRGYTTPVGTVVGRVGPLTETAWNQSYPYNAFMDSCTVEESEKFGSSYRGRYPTGCLVTAIAQIMAYFRPNLTIPAGDNSGSVTLDWDVLQERPTIFGWEYAKIRQVASLMKYIADETKTTFDASGGSTTIPNARSFLNSKNIIMDNPVSGFSASKIKASLDNLNMVLMSGARMSEKGIGRHSWLIDGYQVCKKRTASSTGDSFYKYYNLYFNMNWGWGGSDNGTFLVDSDTSMDFTTNEGKYDRDLTICCNVRTK